MAVYPFYTWRTSCEGDSVKEGGETCIRDYLEKGVWHQEQNYRAAVKLLSKGINGTEQERRDIAVSQACEAMVNLVHAMLPQSNF
jgi:hypothetical protein